MYDRIGNGTPSLVIHHWRFIIRKMQNECTRKMCVRSKKNDFNAIEFSNVLSPWKSFISQWLIPNFGMFIFYSSIKLVICVSFAFFTWEIFQIITFGFSVNCDLLQLYYLIMTNCKTFRFICFRYWQFVKKIKALFLDWTYNHCSLKYDPIRAQIDSLLYSSVDRIFSSFPAEKWTEFVKLPMTIRKKIEAIFGKKNALMTTTTEVQT